MLMMNKKMVKNMSKIFKFLYNILDKLIVTPISRFIYFFNKKTAKSRGWFDKLLNKSQFLVYLSLFFAVVTFLLIDNKVVNLVETKYDVITNVAVVVKYNSIAYVVEGVPETVDITITGRSGDIYLAKQLGNHTVELDLTNYQASDTAYKVEYKYTKSVDNLTYKLSQSYATVTIKKKVSEVMPVTYDLLNTSSLAPELSVESLVLDKSEVVVKGSEETLAEISSVKALVDLEKQNITSEGTYNVADIILVAYDNSGHIMENVEIVPETTTAEMTVSSYFKNLPIQITTTGSLLPGKAISSIQINGSDTTTLKVYGDKDLLEDLVSIPVSIDIDGLGKDSTKSYNVSISKPNGVTHIDNDTVTVVVTFADEEQTTIDIGTKIPHKNLEDGLTANVVSTSGITVQAKGVQSVLDKLTAEDILAYVDLKGLGVGEHTVEVKVENNNPLVSYVVTSTIKIKISD